MQDRSQLKSVFIELLQKLNNGEQFTSEEIELEYEKEKQLIDLLYTIDDFPLYDSDENIYCFINSKRKHFDKYHIEDITNLIIDYVNKPYINNNSKKPSEIIIDYSKNIDGKPIDLIVYDFASSKNKCKDSSYIKSIILENATKEKKYSDKVLTEKLLKYATDDRFSKDIANIITEQKRFSTLNKEIQEIIKESKLPRRDDDEYQIISSYEPYELTHCISYEMAIRNKDVKILLEKIKTLTLLTRDLFKVDMLHKNDSALFYIMEIEEQREKILESLNTLNIKLNIDFESSSLTEIQSELFRLIAEYTVLLEEDYYMIYDRKDIVPEGMEDVFKEPNHYESDIELNQYMYKAIEESIRNAYDPNPRYKDNYTVKDGYVTYQACYEGSKEYDINKIKPNFKRPMREFNQTEISFNMSLPKDELISYISKIKDDYDNKNTPYKTLNQLLYEDDSRIEEKLDHTQKNRYADDFFIYDYYTQSDKEHEKKLESIQKRLSQFHGKKVEKGRNNYESIDYNEANKIEVSKNNQKQTNSISFYDLSKSFKSKEHIIHYLAIEIIEERYNKIKESINDKKYKTLIHHG
ncbi:hypothetical protein [Aliarcobacter cryaerophilus]|uniref:hypothetical protein n=1 Tax=Aliarcobacter cryaerophilus TaxID=28198 RepID=UPI0021B6D0F2|nr:hypothetical protein [Aliarcobacter cryaerophilus]MCT7473666.1 hypothetical protein [Aliarcobacter cryaerophilus]